MYAHGPQCAVSASWATGAPSFSSRAVYGELAGPPPGGCPRAAPPLLRASSLCWLASPRRWFREA
eukprot:4632558-Alexandrium_andersonii.AAC.1